LQEGVLEAGAIACLAKLTSRIDVRHVREPHQRSTSSSPAAALRRLDAAGPLPVTDRRSHLLVDVVEPASLSCSTFPLCAKTI
jgi:hypothetical protein